MNNLFVWIRVLHILMAALWIGATVLTTYMLMPVLDAAGAEGNKLMTALNRRGFGAFFGIVGGVTVVTGVYLFWHFTVGFDMAYMKLPASHVFLTGGVLGLASLIIGGSVIGRSADKLAKGVSPDEAIALKKRMASWGRVVVVMLVVTLVLMAIGHYV